MMLGLVTSLVTPVLRVEEARRKLAHATIAGSIAVATVTILYANISSWATVISRVCKQQQESWIRAYSELEPWNDPVEDLRRDLQNIIPCASQIADTTTRCTKLAVLVIDVLYAPHALGLRV
ncbi:uncharacterized protein F5147DRAFT_648921 [Suillus discolor]|uniref:Uncharacterized protein n=1 Tax=Suillus discolor TaxID=1912936 RepID=A0A9P7FES1_9AGAM|nr:uncharacterized protein F5147DRAFT_648921 [Suillus discolor]KAG2116417.1 hypothetical protein F5147DRAFT_648921 [Suillus discolor]